MRILMVAARCYPFMGDIETHIQGVGPRLVRAAQRLRSPPGRRDGSAFAAPSGARPDTSGLRELAAKGLCRSIPSDAGPTELAAAMVEELEARREIPDLALPDWDACAQALSDVYRDAVPSWSTVRLPPSDVLSWPPVTRA